MSDYVSLAKHKNTSEDHRRAKQLREQASFAERLLWNDLRQMQKDIGLRFRRQQPVHPYIVDFMCVKAKLVVEIDGDSHEIRQDYDAVRNRFLEKTGYKFLRFTNDEVYRNREGVVVQIMETAQKLAYTSTNAVFCISPLTPPSAYAKRLRRTSDRDPPKLLSVGGQGEGD